jgi:hypothetical protein
MVCAIFILDFNLDIVGFAISQGDDAAGQLQHHRILKRGASLQPECGSRQNAHVPNSPPEFTVCPDGGNPAALAFPDMSKRASHVGSSLKAF